MPYMKRILALVTMCLMTVGLAQAAPTDGRASLIYVKRTHQPVNKHKAHKATKHHAPKRRKHQTA
jgi:hypothetical protein